MSTFDDFGFIKIPQLGIDFGEIASDAVFNTTTQARNHVEQRTGLFNAYYPIAKLIGNNGLGPHLDLGMYYSATTNNQAGIGDGWSLPFSVYNIASQVLFLSSGETVLFRSDQETLKKPGYTLTRSSHGIEIRHKNGQTENLRYSYSGGITMLPERISAANGSGWDIEWEESQVLDENGDQYSIATQHGRLYLRFQKLKKIINDDRTILVAANYERGGATIEIWPGTDEEQIFKLTIDDKYCLTQVGAPNGEFQDFSYTEYPYCGYILSALQGSAGLDERVEYKKTGINFLGEHKASLLPAVSCHTLRLCSSQPAIVTQYSYELTAEGNYITTTQQKKSTTVYSYDVFRALKFQKTSEDGHTITQCFDYTGESAENPPRQTSTTYGRPAKRQEQINEKARLEKEREQLIIELEVASDARDYEKYYPVERRLATNTSALESLYSMTITRTEKILNYYSESGNISKNVQGNVTTEWAYYSAQDTTLLGPLGLTFTCGQDPETYPKKEWATYANADGSVNEIYAKYISYIKIIGVRYSGKYQMLPATILTVRGSSYSLQTNTYFSEGENNGRLKTQVTALLDPSGAEIALSRNTVSLEYSVNSGALTTITRHSGDEHEQADFETSETVSIRSGRLIAQVDALGNRSTFEYDATGRLVTHTRCADDPEYANSATYEYAASAAGRRVIITEKGVRKAFTTDEGNNSISEEVFTDMGYDVSQPFIAKNYPPYKRELYGQLLSAPDPAQGKRWYLTAMTQYDGRGRPVRQHHNDMMPNGQVILEHDEYQYDAWSQRSAVVPSFGKPTYRRRDLVLNTVTEQLGSTGSSQVTTLDDDQRVKLVEDFAYEGSAPNYRTTFEYSRPDDLEGSHNPTKPTRVVTEDLQSSEKTEYLFSYDDFDRVRSETVTGPAVNTAGNCYTLTHDYPPHLTGEQASEIACIYTRDDGTIVTQVLGSRAFDRNGRVLALTRGDQFEHFTYSGANTSPHTRVAGALVGDQIQSTTTAFKYIAQLNNVLANTETNGATAYYTYAFNGAGTSTVSSGSSHQSVIFNSLEQAVTQTRLPEGETGHTRNYTYSLMGRIASESNGFGLDLVHQYGYRGSHDSSKSSDLHVQRSYNSDGDLEDENVIDHLAGRSYQWIRRFAGGHESVRIFDDGLNGQISFNYDRNAEGKVTFIRSSKYEVTLGTKSYRYNANGSLSQAIYTGEFAFNNSNDNSPFIYTFDPLGNLTAVTTQDGTTSFTYDSITGVRLSQVENLAITYYPTGQIQAKGDNGYSLNTEYRQISCITQSSGKMTSYSYNPDEVVTQISNSTPWLLQKLNLVYRHGRIASQYLSNPDRTGFDKIVDLRVSSPGLIVQRTTEAGNITTQVMFLDTDGTVIYTHDVETRSTHLHRYTPYGLQPELDDNPVTRRSILGFKGEHVLQDPQLYPLGNGYRLYDPELMRFSSVDDWSPFGAGGINSYAYCDGDPINRADPNGHGFFSSLWSGIKSVFSAIATAVVTVWNYSPVGMLINKFAEKFPIASAVFWGVVGIALAAFTGGGSLFLTAAAVGAAIVSAGLNIASACIAESDPELSKTLGWASLGAGVVSGLAVMGKQIHNLGLQLGRSARSVAQNVASRASMMAAKVSRVAAGRIRGTQALAESLADKSLLWLERSAKSASTATVRKAMEGFSRADVLEDLVYAGSGALSLSDVGSADAQKAADSLFSFNELSLQREDIERVANKFHKPRAKTVAHFRFGR